MPILIKDFTWTQSPKVIHIRIPIDPFYRENIDFFTCDSYVKIHFPPFLLEIFLLHEIDSDLSKCVVKNDQILLDLLKRDEIAWDHLEKPLTRDEKMKSRQEILERNQEKMKTQAENRALRKNQLDRFTVQKAMELDNIQHELMDTRRNAERCKAMNNLEQWRISIDKPQSTSTSDIKIIELPSSEDEDESKEKETNMVPNRKVQLPVKSDHVEKMKEEQKTRILPKMREAAVLEIRHTPRSFPTPSRESTADEEDAWLKNITSARRATGFVSEELRPEEQDPQWCKEKGDEFFRCGNFLGAISAYTHGITLSDKFPTLFANRAATHFALGNFNKCINDCSTALDLMTPACEGNRRSRAKCIVRRGAALARLGYLSKAIDEMKAAAKLLPDDQNVKKDIYDMERAWEQNPDSD